MRFLEDPRPYPEWKEVFDPAFRVDVSKAKVFVEETDGWFNYPFRLKPEVEQWCKDNLRGAPPFHDDPCPCCRKPNDGPVPFPVEDKTILQFRSKRDAALFKLFWC